MIVALYIEDNKIDLFDDESIEITSAIADVEDITRNKTDFAKGFTVPASDNNNAIFKHYYDANIDNSFDARVRKSGKIELDGMPFRTGSWALEKVNVKQGNPQSYTINFVGNLFSIKDIIRNDELSDLDLDALNFDYTSANIKSKLTSKTDDVIYVPFSFKQYFYDSTGAQAETATSKNIAYPVGTGLVWNELKPAIKLEALITAIQDKYGFTFSNDFFGTNEFKELYMLVNNSTSNGSVANSVRVDITNIGDIPTDIVTINLANDTIENNDVVVQVYSGIEITPSVGYEGLEYSIDVKVNGSVAFSFTGLRGVQFINDSLAVSGYKYTYHVSCPQDFKFTAKLKIETIEFSGGFIRNNYSATFSEQTIDTIVTITNNLPKMKVIDFLTGIFKMFKLVVISDENQNVYVDTLQSYYSKGRIWDLSEYIKRDSIDISRPELLNKISFKFKEGTTILNKQFKDLTGFYYGDEEVLLTDDGTITGKPLDGAELSIELPFENILYERLPDLGDDPNYSEFQYGCLLDDKLDAVNPAPHIFYVINRNIGSKTIGFVNDSLAKEELSSTINIPSLSYDLNTQPYNLVWGLENNPFTNVSSQNTLYYNHYKTYIEDIFNSKRRNYNIKAIIPLRVLLQMNLNDVIEIDKNYYRFNNYNLNLITQDVTLNLVKTFDTVINGFFASEEIILVDYLEQSKAITITGFTNVTITKVDPGDGVTWLDYVLTGTVLTLNFDENELITNRSMQINIVNDDTLQEIDINILQTSNDIRSFRFYLDKNTQYLPFITN